jgi:hypothetical protein
MCIELFPGSVTQISNESCILFILGVIIGDNLTFF